jgi:cephalosporin hydroxylase
MSFEAEVRERIAENGSNQALHSTTEAFMLASLAARYSYNFSCLGRPIIQYPQDMVAMQEIIWQVRPDLIIETGIAHGGSLILSASMLALLDLADAIEAGTPLDPRKSSRLVLGVDVDIRAHNRTAIEAHPMASRIRMIQGSSVASEVVEQVKSEARNYPRVLVCLDSNHTGDHVLEELEAYTPLVSAGSYCVVFDTIIEAMPPDLIGDRPWKPGNSPKTAVSRFLAEHPEFEIDFSIENKLQIPVAPHGYLRRVR